ncbi:hypothetical protein P9B03_07310 [Metasolibacillus meyeri]|uniref:Carboxypeptidase regulatory-like domain-containing protein n=1 Tax=Metasolibacillus meyeri TaxID=1071052 RepID=A0AAW9NUU8_9BACL|nr:hypothetical protein [Metasolibacillus meyeri]MEC1178285.1 hypothetical protein [Metasolibacillus meyeri]
MGTEQPILWALEGSNERRTTAIYLKPKFIIDRDQNSFQTDEKGMIEGYILYEYSTVKESQLAVFAFLENDITPIKIKMNGVVASYHMIDLPNEGGTFTITNLPRGNHILYIISEKVLNNTISDPVEIYDTQITVARNFLSIKVQNERTETSTIPSSYATVEKIQDSKNDTSVIMQMYEDSNLTKEVDFINNIDDYFLTIENQYDFEMKAHLKLISGYETLELQQILIPANAKVLVPTNFQAFHINKSARIIMVAAPSEKLDIPYALRVVKTTKRFPIENHTNKR